MRWVIIWNLTYNRNKLEFISEMVIKRTKLLGLAKRFESKKSARQFLSLLGYTDIRGIFAIISWKRAEVLMKEYYNDLYEKTKKQSEDKLNILSSRLRKCRLDLKLSQQDVAYIFGVNRTTISSYEIGDRIPDIATLCRLSVLYNVSLDYLLDNKLDENFSVEELHKSIYEKKLDHREKLKKDAKRLLKTAQQ